MADTYRGLTIRFGGDTTKLNDSLRGVARAASTAQRALKEMRNASKLDPGNMQIARNQLRLYGESATLAAEKLRKLAIAQKQLKATKLTNGQQLGAYAKGLDSVSAKAEQIHERYNKANAALERVKSTLQSLYAKAGGKGELFKDFDKATVRSILGHLERMGALTDEDKQKVRALAAEYKRLGQEQRSATAGMSDRDALRQFDAARNKAAQLSAEIRRARIETEKLQAARMERFVAGITRASESIAKLKAEGKSLDKYLKIDPGNIDLARERMQLYEQQIREAAVEYQRLNRYASAMKAKSGFLSGDAASGKADAAALAAQYKKANTELSKQSIALKVLKADLRIAEEEAAQLAIKYGRSSVEFRKSAEEVNRLKASITQVEAKVSELNSKFRAVGNDLSYARVTGEMERLKVSANKAAAAMTTVNSKTRLSASSMLTFGMTMYSSVTPAAMMLGTHAVQAAKDIDGAYRNMRKTVNGTEQDFTHLRDAALEYSQTHFTSADQILEIEAIGGQLGIATRDLEAFSKTISNLNIATNIEDAEELSVQFGKMASVMHLTSGEYERFADSLVRLGNNEPALESDIMKITTRFMGMGAIVGMSADEMLAFATAATATGQGAESAGTSLQRTMGRIEAAVAGVSDGMRNMEDATEEDIEAFETAQGKLQEYADIAGMTAEEFATAWEERPAEAMQAFIEGLKGIDDAGGSVDKALQDLGITGVRDRQLLEGLVNTTDVLSDSLKMSKDAWDGVSDQWGESGDAAREAQRKTEGFSGSLQLLANNFQLLANEMGESLKPIFDALIPMAQLLTSAFASLPGPLKTVTTSLLIAGAAAGPLLTGISSIRTSIKDFRKHSETYGSAINKMASANARAAKSAGLMEAGVKKTSGGLIMTEKGMREYAKSTNQAGNVTAQAAGKMGRITTGAERAAGAMRALGSAAKMIGKAVAFGFAIDALFSIIQAFQEAAEKGEKFKKATTGLKEALGATADGASAADNAFNGLNQGFKYYGVSVDEAIEKQGNLVDTLSKVGNETAASHAVLDTYKNVVHELAGKTSLTANEQEKLRFALGKIDEACGTNYSSIDLANEAWRDQVSAIDEAIEATKRKIEVDAMASAYEEAVAAKMTANQAYSDATKKLNEYVDSHKNLSREQLETDGTFNKLLEDVTKSKQLMDAAGSAVQYTADKLDVMAAASEGARERLTELNLGQDAFIAIAANAKGHVDEFAEGLDMFGANISNVTDKGKQDLADFLSEWDGDLGSLRDKLVEVGADFDSEFRIVGDGIRGGFTDALHGLADEFGWNTDAMREHLDVLNAYVVDGKHVEITDDGTIQIVDDKVEEVKENVESIPDSKSTEVEATGADNVLNVIDKMIQNLGKVPDNKATALSVSGANAAKMALGFVGDAIRQNVPDNKNTNVTTTGTQQANYEIQGVGNTIKLTPDGKHIAISSNATEAAWQLQNVTGQANLIPPYRQVITATPTAGESAGALSNVAGMAFGIPQAVYTAVGAPGAVQATGEMNASTAAANAIPGSEQTSVSAPGATTATNQMQATRSAAYSIPRSVSVSVYANTWGAISAINSVRSALWSINGQSASTYVHTYAIRHEMTVKDAQGSIGFNRNLLDNILMQLPKHAAGGIVDRPTLTSTGWIGEDGAEAIIPLDNPKYVGTFANALAEQLDGSSSGPTYNVYMNDIRVNDDPAIQAALMNLLSEMQRKGAMR